MTKPLHPDYLTEPDEVADAIFARIMGAEAATDHTFANLVSRAVPMALAVNDPARKPGSDVAVLGPIASMDPEDDGDQPDDDEDDWGPEDEDEEPEPTPIPAPSPTDLTSPYHPANVRARLAQGGTYLPPATGPACCRDDSRPVYAFKEGDGIRGEDGDGDEFTALYVERYCGVHGTEPRVVLQVNDEGFAMLVEEIPMVVRFLVTKYHEALNAIRTQPKDTK